MAGDELRLNVTHTSPDTALQKTLDQIDGEHPVTGALDQGGLEGLLQDVQRRRGPPAVRLDLVAHAVGGVLQLGDWAVDDDATARELVARCQPVLAGMPIRSLRLLGCITALTKAGQSAIKRLEATFGTYVYGTNFPISACDFDGIGFVREDLLVPHYDLPPPIDEPAAESVAAGWFPRFQQLPGETVERVLSRLRPEDRDSAEWDRTRTRDRLRWPFVERPPSVFWSCFEHVGDEVARAPGLLALPELEVIAPADDGPGPPRFHRMTLLLYGHVVRVYPRDQPSGVLLRALPSLASALDLRSEYRRSRIR